MANAYDAELRESFRAIAAAQRLPWSEGVYVSYCGPNFETPAEIRMMQIIGGDVVGMSLVPEVISARHCGLKVIAIAAITNLAEGLGDEVVSHEQTLKQASLASVDLQRLILIWLEKQAGGPF